MEKNLTKIKERLNTIYSTQKITKSMKLVSLSKYQKYTSEKHRFDKYMNSLKELCDIESIETSNDKVAIVFAPDLGLATHYIKSSMHFLNKMHMDTIIWIGMAHFDSWIGKGFNVINTKKSSEKIKMEEVYEMLSDKYDYYLIWPSLTNIGDLSFELINCNWEIVQHDDVDYFPNFESVNNRYSILYRNALLYDCFLESKIVEHKLRQIMMEKANENAEELEKDLLKQFNRVRQEKITQEINEITSGKE